MSLSKLSGPAVLIVNLCRHETDQTQNPLQKTEDTSSVVLITITVTADNVFLLLCTYMSPRTFLIVDNTILSTKIINILMPCQSQYATVVALVIHF